MSTTAATNDDHMPYEGAGFLLSFHHHAILGQRIKKDKDLAKDPTPELGKGPYRTAPRFQRPLPQSNNSLTEYMGGKVELEADQNTPANTARAELIEELGADILDDSWQDRAHVIHVFQPFSKKWIWCFRLDLNDVEYARLQDAARNLKEWPAAEVRDFSHLTNRPEPARKALERLVVVPLDYLVAYVRSFSTMASTHDGNRMKDAKVFRDHHALRGGHDILDDQVVIEHGLRAFNTVMFENHIAELYKNL